VQILPDTGRGDRRHVSLPHRENHQTLPCRGELHCITTMGATHFGWLSAVCIMIPSCPCISEMYYLWRSRRSACHFRIDHCQRVLQVVSPSNPPPELKHYFTLCYPGNTLTHTCHSG
jgi:hypothetical protein